jgi:hypothetical protein
MSASPPSSATDTRNVSPWSALATPTPKEDATNRVITTIDAYRLPRNVAAIGSARFNRFAKICLRCRWSRQRMAHLEADHREGFPIFTPSGKAEGAGEERCHLTPPHLMIGTEPVNFRRTTTTRQ